MTAYAVGQLRDVDLNQGIVDYLHGIDATLAPFKGRFIIHGGRKDALEGRPDNDLIVIAFPSLEAARGWYASPTYQALIPLRRQGSKGEVFLIDGVPESHRATDILDGQQGWSGQISVGNIDRNPGSRRCRPLA